jgi:hypothetical protein
MREPILIAGMPRSRSAWWSNLLTFGPTFVAHDGLFRSNIDELICKLRSGEWQGHSDSANVLWWQTLNEAFPKAKWVVVKRPIADVLDSCRKIVPSISTESIGAFSKRLDDLIYFLNPKIVEFDVIDSDECFDVANYLEVDIGSCERVKQLCDFNVQVHPLVLKRRLEELMQQPIKTEHE